MSDDSTLEVIEGGLSNAEPPCEQVGITPSSGNIFDDLGIKTPSPAALTLKRAEALIDGDRNDQHGDRHECHKLVADLWSSYFGIQIRPDQVAIAMALLKIARTKTGSDNADCYTDLCGYGAIAGELSSRK